MNFSPGTDEDSNSLRLPDVKTVVHEMGHIFHRMFSEAKMRALSENTEFPIDGIEIPSMLLEQFIWEPEVLQLFAKTQLPQEFLDSLPSIRDHRKDANIRTGLGGQMVDLLFHNKYKPKRDGDVHQYCREILKEYYPCPVPEEQTVFRILREYFW